MPLIKTTAPGEAEGKLAELYAEVEQMFGMVPNNVQMLGVSPPVLENQLQIIEYYVGHSTLSMPFLAMLRMLVSQQSESPYCLSLNRTLLAQAGFTREQIEQAKSDPGKSPLSDKENSLLSLALKATKEPHLVSAKDIEQLKTMGWSERDIFDAVAHGARSVASNIIFDTFKIEKDL